MSLEFKAFLNRVASEECVREQAEIEQGLKRYMLLLQKIAAEKKLDVLTTFEGVEYHNNRQRQADMKVLEKAHLVAGQTKYTHRNAYRQYTLTKEGLDLAEKLLKEKEKQSNATAPNGS